MKIGIDCRIFSSKFTGIGRYTHELVNHYTKLNAELKSPHELVLFFNNPEFREFKESKNVKKVLVDARHYSMSEQFKFLKILNKECLDVVHFPHFNLPIFYRRPYIVTIHDLTLSLFPGQKMTKWFQRLAYNIVIRRATKKAKKIIAVSNNTKNDLINMLKVPEEKIEVIYNGIGKEFSLIEDTKVLEGTLKKYGIDKEFLLYTGVWRNHKNLPRLIKAFGSVRNKYGIDLKLVITGKPDPYYPEVKNEVKNLGLENEVIFPGLVDEKELVHLYNSALFYVFPSLYEGFGMPPLESMKCGTPVLASNTSSIPEICGDGNAIFFDPNNEEEIAEKIKNFFEDPALQADLIEKGMIRADEFSWEDTAKKTWEILVS